MHVRAYADDSYMPIGIRSRLKVSSRQTEGQSETRIGVGMVHAENAPSATMATRSSALRTPVRYAVL